MTKRWTAALALAGAVLLGGCKREEKPPEPAKPGTAAAPTEVTLQLFGDPAEVEGYRQLISAFEAKNPDVKVRLVPIGKQKDHMAKLTTAFSGGTPPDLFLINYRRFAQFAAKDVLEPLGPRLEKSTVLKERDFYPQAVEAFRYDGALECLPQNVSSLVVYWNRALFQRLGVPPPKPDWTWDDFRKTAQALTRDENGDGRMDVHGLAFEPTLSRLAPFIWQAGGDIVDDVNDPRHMQLLNEPALEALRFVLRLQRVFKVTPSLEEAKSENHEARFAAGRLGMLLNSRRLVPTLRAVPDLDWDVAPLPRHHKTATVLHSDAYCMSRASKAKDAAFRFVEFALGSTGAELVARGGRTVPSLKRVAESPAFLDPNQRPASARVFLDSILSIRRLPNVAVWNEVETRADVIVEEWFYTVPPHGTQLTESDSKEVRPGQEAGGSMRRLLRQGNEVNALGQEVTEAVQGILDSAPKSGTP
ncbi:sugar ABC transporter substrate-binding protein [Pyxidicoccus fallax]|uniref:Sugar ABC transporter substrate-binding protein n=1 Tax=Pyxidicoccus fallax TaxID=394095 RepID=A0A848LDK8_9BACT|nr:sugar ABC transporter substrate-binding protein [Pyxidicoccus fallax]NMO14883.1 sugar ABC transporter substrate-binding protein [Pyxidicoccus fallax]NPC77816.1 sugar ABC transporter substrate-binding protein [Pyxidicoccus fallax]